MSKYLKMSDVFNPCDVVETDVKVLYAVSEEFDDVVTPNEYAHHAIQYHDELVEMNRGLLEALAEIDACFEAALVDGWNDAVSDNDMHRVKDIYSRRIDFARSIAVEALAGGKA